MKIKSVYTIILFIVVSVLVLLFLVWRADVIYQKEYTRCWDLKNSNDRKASEWFAKHGEYPTLPTYSPDCAKYFEL